MSADKVNKQVEKLLHEARQTTDPETLHDIADKLQRLGAWNEAAGIRRKAGKFQDKYVEAVWTK